MHIIEYIWKRVSIYIGLVIVCLLIHLLLTQFLKIPFDTLRENLFMAVMFFGYPFYRVVRSIIDLIVIYYGGEDQKNGKVAGIFHVLDPEIVNGKPKGQFLINLLSKFFQLIMLATITYAFIMNDFSVLRIFALIFTIGGMIFFAAFIKTQRGEYRKRNAVQLKNIEKIRQSKGGISIDISQKRKFLELPRKIFWINIAIVTIGFTINFITSHLPFTIASQTLLAIRIIGILAFFTMPISGAYFMQQCLRSHMYTLKIGKGDYGQEKIEFFTYDGLGDEMNDTRHIIDRIEWWENGSRYIKLQKVSNFYNIKIPKTMSKEDELNLLKVLRRMEKPSNIMSREEAIK